MTIKAKPQNLLTIVSAKLVILDDINKKTCKFLLQYKDKVLTLQPHSVCNTSSATHLSKRPLCQASNNITYSKFAKGKTKQKQES